MLHPSFKKITTITRFSYYFWLLANITSPAVPRAIGLPRTRFVTLTALSAHPLGLLRRRFRHTCSLLLNFVLLLLLASYQVCVAPILFYSVTVLCGLHDMVRLLPH